MHNLLKANISNRAKITDEEFEKILSRVKLVHLKKKKFILKAGEISRHYIFVGKGVLRTFSIDEKGIEHVTQLAIEDHWSGDLYSLLSNQPTGVYIEALEDCDLILISKEAMDILYKEVPALERMFRILVQNAYMAALKRLNSAFSESAEERYLDLIQKQPGIVQRVPLVHIASYLGITPESLSRIRKQIAKK